MSNENFPSFWERIEYIKELKRINIIVIDGKAQTGKSTLARYIAKRYDPDPIRVWTLEQLMDYLEMAEKLYYSGRFAEILNKFIVMEEPQLDSPKQEFWSARNAVIQAITSSFGFLKNHLILALPNIYGLSNTVYTNITLRMSVYSKLDKNRKIVRFANIQKPIWSDFKHKFYWRSVENYKIPELEEEKGYIDEKANNFFKIHLKRWKEKLKYDPFQIKVEGATIYEE